MHRFRLGLFNGPRVVRNLLRERRWIGHIFHGKSLAFEGEGACFRWASQRDIIKLKTWKRTRLPYLKVDTVPIKLCTTKLLPPRSNGTLCDVQLSFAHLLGGILEVDYEGLRVCDEDIKDSETAVNNSGVVDSLHHVDDVQSWKAGTLVRLQ